MKKQMPLTWTPIKIEIGKIVPWAHNPRMSTKADAERLIKSWTELGQMQTLAVGPADKTGMVPLYDGHQRCSAWMTVKPPHYQVLALQSNRPLTEEERRKVAVLTRTAAGRWDWEALSGWDAGELKEWGMDKDTLNGWNNDANNLKEILYSEARPESDALPEVDRAQELIKKWKVKTGSIYQIGEHRIMCGDATNRQHVDRLMAGELADLVFTDPPYGVTYTGNEHEGGREWKMLDNDNLRLDALEEFLTSAFSILYQVTHPNTALYCFHAAKTQKEFEHALVKAGYEMKQQLVWNKGFGFNRFDYHWAHEPIFYCKKKSQTTKWYGDRTSQTILGSKRTDLEKFSKAELIKIITAAMDASTNWEIDRDSVTEYVHSTQKPARLAARAMQNSSAAGQIVIDFFSGSGSTMVAAENMGRRGRSMELTPGYVAVSINRMETAFPSLTIRKLE